MRTIGDLIQNSLAGSGVSFAPTRRSASRNWLNRNSATGQLAQMGSVGTLFSIVDLLASEVAATNWHLYRKPIDGRRRTPSPAPYERTEVTVHAALDLWNKPNPFYTQQEFVETFTQHLELVGETEWLVSRDGLGRADIPLEMWPIRPDKIKPVPHPEEFLAGWVYFGPDGEQVPLELDEIIQLKRPNPLDMYRGMGPVQSLLADLDSVKYSAEWNRNFFLNSAEPGGIIEVDKRLSDPEFKEMADRWNEQHRGVRKAHRVALIEQGRWVDRSFSMRDMQFTQLREVSRNVIMEAFRIHKHMLGISEDVNRANAEAADVVFARRLKVPRLERIKGVLNNDFLPLFGDAGKGLEFDYENPVPDDREADNAERESRASAFKTLVDAGVDPESAAETVGLPPMKYKSPAQPEPVPAGVE